MNATDAPPVPALAVLIAKLRALGIACRVDADTAGRVYLVLDLARARAVLGEEAAALLQGCAAASPAPSWPAP